MELQLLTFKLFLVTETSTTCIYLWHYVVAVTKVKTVRRFVLAQL